MYNECLKLIENFIKEEVGSDVIVRVDQEKFDTLVRRDRILITRQEQYKTTYVNELAIQYFNDLSKLIMQDIDSCLPGVLKSYPTDSLLTRELVAEIQARSNQFAHQDYERLIFEDEENSLWVIVHHSEKGNTFLETMANIGITVWKAIN